MIRRDAAEVFAKARIESGEIKVRASKIRNDLLLYRQKRKVKELVAPNLYNNELVETSGMSLRAWQVNKWIIRECPNLEALTLLLSAIQNQKMKAKEARILRFEYKVLAALWDLAVVQRHSPTFLKDIAEVVEGWGYGRVDSKGVGKVLREAQLHIAHHREGEVVRVAKVQLERLFKSLDYPIPEASPSSQSSRDDGVADE